MQLYDYLMMAIIRQPGHAVLRYNEYTGIEIKPT